MDCEFSKSQKLDWKSEVALCDYAQYIHRPSFFRQKTRSAAIWETEVKVRIRHVLGRQHIVRV